MPRRSLRGGRPDRRPTPDRTPRSGENRLITLRRISTIRYDAVLTASSNRWGCLKADRIETSACAGTGSSSDPVVAGTARRQGLDG